MIKARPPQFYKKMNVEAKQKVCFADMLEGSLIKKLLL